jgi:hypothetical protein
LAEYDWGREVLLLTTQAIAFFALGACRSSTNKASSVLSTAHLPQAEKTLDMDILYSLTYETATPDQIFSYLQFSFVF